MKIYDYSKTKYYTHFTMFSDFHEWLEQQQAEIIDYYETVLIDMSISIGKHNNLIYQFDQYLNANKSIYDIWIFDKSQCDFSSNPYLIEIDSNWYGLQDSYYKELEAYNNEK